MAKGTVSMGTNADLMTIINLRSHMTAFVGTVWADRVVYQVSQLHVNIKKKGERRGEKREKKHRKRTLCLSHTLPLPSKEGKKKAKKKKKKLD